MASIDDLANALNINQKTSVIEAFYGKVVALGVKTATVQIGNSQIVCDNFHPAGAYINCIVLVLKLSNGRCAVVGAIDPME